VFPLDENKPPVGFENNPLELFENKLFEVFGNNPLPFVVFALLVNKFENRFDEAGLASYFLWFPF
jgi:hypothetical protein